MIACYKDDAVLSENTISDDPLTKAQSYLAHDGYVKMVRHKITTNRAMQIAEEARGLFSDETERVIRGRSVVATLAPVAVTKQSRARSAAGADTLMYIVNYSNDNGFVFVSNDDRDGEILMYSGNGNFAMQDTAGNPGLKLHVEMMIAYQEHKLSEMRAAEARGEDYTGSMVSEEASSEDMPNILPSTRGVTGMPGMPGQVHTCNVTGQPGMPGLPGTARQDICAPATYEYKGWYGNSNAIALAKNKYRNQRCFGVPTPPPSIDFSVEGPPGPDQPCATPPYCNPRIHNWQGYYESYGCKIEMMISSSMNVTSMEVAPLLTTYWDQGEPLKHGSNSAGCGPIAMAQIMAYHAFPKIYNIDILRTLRTNTDLENSPYKMNAADFLEEIRDRLNVFYQSDGSTSVSTLFGSNVIRATFKDFGYTTNDGGLDYNIDRNFNVAVNNIHSGYPVLIFGNAKGELTNGHMWVLDGYRRIVNRYHEAEFLFNEYGQLNSGKAWRWQAVNTEYIHANYGWGTKWADMWVERGVYEFGGTNYNGSLRIVANIKPNK